MKINFQCQKNVKLWITFSSLIYLACRYGNISTKILLQNLVFSLFNCVNRKLSLSFVIVENHGQNIRSYPIILWIPDWFGFRHSVSHAIGRSHFCGLRTVAWDDAWLVVKSLRTIAWRIAVHQSTGCCLSDAVLSLYRQNFVIICVFFNCSSVVYARGDKCVHCIYVH